MRSGCSKICLAGVLFAVVLVAASPAWALGQLEWPKRDWTFSGPGGLYGVEEQHDGRTYVKLGPASFGVPVGAHAVLAVTSLGLLGLMGVFWRRRYVAGRAAGADQRYCRDGGETYSRMVYAVSNGALMIGMIYSFIAWFALPTISENMHGGHSTYSAARIDFFMSGAFRWLIVLAAAPCIVKEFLVCDKRVAMALNLTYLCFLFCLTLWWVSLLV